jgi:hypothetical protein
MRWGHLHTLLAGLLAGASLERTHLWLILAAVFACGLVAGRCWGILVNVETLIRRKVRS